MSKKWGKRVLAMVCDCHAEGSPESTGTAVWPGGRGRLHFEGEAAGEFSRWVRSPDAVPSVEDAKARAVGLGLRVS